MAFSSFSVGIRPLLPSEFSVTASSGIYTHWQATLKHDLALDRPRSISRSSWWQTWVNPLPSIRSCLKDAPLLLRFSREIEKEQRSTFWQLLGLNAVQAALPAAELWFSSELISIAHAASTGVPIAFTHRFYIILAGRLSSTVVTLLVDRACSAMEQVLTSSFALRVQTQVLKLHCTLSDEELDTPTIKRQLSLLRELGGGSAQSMYRRVFDPVGAIGVASGFAGVLLSAVVLAKQVSGRNAVLLAVSMGFMALEEWDAWGVNQPVIEHYDVTNDAWIRFQNMFRLGISRRHRPEMTMLGLHPYILSSALDARHQLVSSTTAQQLTCTTSPACQPAPLRPMTVLLALSRPLSTAIFILHASTAAARASPATGLVSLAELAVLEQACWTLRVKWASLSRGVREVQGGLEKLAALYACEQDPPLDALTHDHVESNELEHGVDCSSGASSSSRSGLALSFRNVEMKYDPGAVPALQDVTFDVEPGQIVAVCGQNGSGKTSLVSLLAGIEARTAGEMLLDGRSIDSYSRLERARMMKFTLQSSASLPMSIKEYVSLGALAGQSNVSDDGFQVQLEEAVARALSATTAASVIEVLQDGDLCYPAGSTTGYDEEWTQLPRLVPRERPITPMLELLRLDGGASDSMDRPGDESESDTLAKSTDTLVGLGPASAADSTSQSRATEGGEKEDGQSGNGNGLARKKRPTPTQWTAVPTLLSDGREASVNFALHAPGRVALSGGQWQRIALARSLCMMTTTTEAVEQSHAGRLLVWDEPAAALDPVAEGALFDTLERLRGTCTVIFTTHRLSACLRADKVLLFDRGRLTEQGSPAELLQRKNGAFASMYKLQADAYAPAASRDGRS